MFILWAIQTYDAKFQENLLVCDTKRMVCHTLVDPSPLEALVTF